MSMGPQALQLPAGIQPPGVMAATLACHGNSSGRHSTFKSRGCRHQCKWYLATCDMDADAVRCTYCSGGPNARIGAPSERGGEHQGPVMGQPVQATAQHGIVCSQYLLFPPRFFGILTAHHSLQLQLQRHTTVLQAQCCTLPRFSSFQTD